MKTLDPRKAIPDTLTSLDDRGDPASVTAVLERLGVAPAPTLRPSESTEAWGRQDGEPVSLGRFQLLGELGRGGMGRVLEAPTRRSAAESP